MRTRTGRDTGRSVTVVALGAALVLAASPGLIAARAQTEPSNRNTDLARRAILAWPSEDVTGGVEFIEASHLSRGPSTIAVGMVGDLVCRDLTDQSQPCVGASFLKKIRRRNFEMDNGLSSASLTMTVDHQVHQVTWEGEGAHSYRNGRLKRPAEASGVVYGEHAEDEGPRSLALMTNGTRAGRLPGPFVGAGRSARIAALCSSISSAEKRFLTLMNEERKKKGLVPVKMDAELVRVSRKHTNEMINRSTLYHTSSDQLGQRVTKWRTLGENIGAGATPDSLHTAFMNSPTHRDNILFTGYRFAGIGTKSANGVLWVTVTFERSDNPGTRIAC